MTKIDSKDKQIIAELITNPRKSNKEIVAKTAIPEKTIARRRQKIESEIMRQYVEIDNSHSGSNQFTGSAIYSISFANTITRNQILTAIQIEKLFSAVPQKHVKHMFLGDNIDSVTLFIVLESFNHEELIDIVNADIIPVIKHRFGEHAIKKVDKSDNFTPLIYFTNYSVKDNSVVSKRNVYVSE